MDFDFSEAQNIMLNSAKNFLEKEAWGVARDAEKTDKGYSEELWKKMAELGWFGVVLPEEYGGISGTFVDLVLLLEEIGKAIAPGPVIAAILCGLSILEFGSESQKEEFLPKIIDGSLILSHALIEPDTKLGENKIDEQVIRNNGDFKISGTRLLVPFSHIADWILYYTVTDKGNIMFMIDASTPGIRSIPLNSIGGDKPCELILKDVITPASNILGHEGNAEEILKKINLWGALTYSAYILGMLEQSLTMTVAHAKEREQFEKKIGSFQAIQHQCANMATDIDQIKFLTYQAAWRLSQGLSAEKEISMAKAWASDASRRVCLLGIKIHGGIGVSEEYDMQLYFRRAKAFELTFGDGDYHREIVAQKCGL
ncbi:MAG: acyl-CoA dehydrogenase family protein [Spirochaetota bacterium]|nr:acyl-CoA dehydrogenase family protein [Spirochaetota bacterium]